MQYYENLKEQEGLVFKWIAHGCTDSFPLHWHSHMEILYILKGQIDIIVEKETYSLVKHDIIVINSNELHRTMQRDKSEVGIFGIQVNPEFFKEIVPRFLQVRFNADQFIGKQSKQLEVIKQSMREIFMHVSSEKKYSQLYLNGLVNILLYKLFNEFEYTFSEESTSQISSKDFLRLKRILDFIEANYNKKVSLKQIAELEYLNVYYVSHFFKNKMGIGFKDYVDFVRLKKSSDMLLMTGLNVVDIMNACGFSDEKSFYRMFKKKYGVTPNRYRKEYAISKVESFDKVMHELYIEIESSPEYGNEVVKQSVKYVNKFDET